MQEQPYAARAATALAMLSVLACLGGLARVVQLGFGHAPALSGFMYWNFVPMLAAVVSTLASFDSRPPVMWIAAGALCGFTILGAWSLGTFYAPAALLAIAAAAAETIAARSWFTAMTTPLWLIAGASSMAVMVIAADIIRQSSGRGIGVTHAPAVVFGGWLFIGALSAIAIAYVGRWMWSMRRSA
jgi:hypothetical protein